MTSATPKLSDASSPQTIPSQHTKAFGLFRYLLPAIVVLFAPILFWITYNLQQSCSPLVGSPVDNGCYIAKVSIEPNPLDPLNVGKSKKLNAKIELKPSNKKLQINKDVTWQSSHPEVASVDSTGFVKTKAIGNTEIIVISKEAPNKKGIIKLVVLPPEPPEILSLRIIPPTSSDHYEGERLIEGQDFRVEVKGKGEYDERVTLESDNPKVASVNNETKSIYLGLRGNAHINAISIADPRKKDSIYITVWPPRLDEIRIQPSYISLKSNQNKSLKLTFEGRGKFDQSVNWSSEDSDIAKVDNNGTVTAKTKGKTKIVAMSQNNPDLQSTVDVSVTDGNIITPPLIAGGVCMAATTLLLVPPPASVAMCMGVAGGLYWLLNH